MPIKVSQLATRTITAPFVYEENGERKTEQCRVVYRALTDKVRQQIDALPKDTTDSARAYLRIVLHALPDIVTEDGKPVEITDDFLRDHLDVTNVAAIFDAINEDVSPKKAPSKTSKSGS